MEKSQKMLIDAIHLDGVVKRDTGKDMVDTMFALMDKARKATRVSGVSFLTLQDVPLSFPPAQHTHPWEQVSGKPDEFPPSSHSHPWEQISGKPASYPPTPHGHGWTEISGKPEVFPPDPATEYDYIDFDTTHVDALTRVGRLTWSADAQTLSLVLPGGSVLDLGQEQYTPRAKNTSGATILDGQVVCIKGASGNSPEVGLANASTASLSKAIAVATQNVPNNNHGIFTTFGMVRDINTDVVGWVEGDELWLDSVDGGLRNTRPPRPNHLVSIGYLIRKHAVNGSILVNIQHFPEIDEIYGQDIQAVVDSKDETGFVDPEGLVVSYDSGTRKITVTHPSGAIEYWWRGRKTILTSPWVSDAHPNSNGSWFLYSTDGINLSWSSTVWEFTHLMVAAVYFGTTDKFAIRECHGMMDWNSHQNWHTAFGTLRISGGGLTAGTFAIGSAADADTTPGVDASKIKDEDIPTNISSLAQGTYTLMYPSGATTMDFTLSNAFPFTSAGSYIQWYNGSTLTTGINARWYNVYLLAVPVTADANSQQYRYLWLQPMAEHASLALAQAENPQLLDLRDFKGKSAEYVFLQRITYSSSAANANTGKVTIAATQALSLTRGPAI